MKTPPHTDKRTEGPLHPVVMRQALDAESHRRATERYLNAAQPILDALCKLELSMPLVYALNPDGTLEKLEQHEWPEWAKLQAAALKNVLRIIHTNAFNDA